MCHTACLRPPEGYGVCLARKLSTLYTCKPVGREKTNQAQSLEKIYCSLSLHAAAGRELVKGRVCPCRCPGSKNPQGVEDLKEKKGKQHEEKNVGERVEDKVQRKERGTREDAEAGVQVIYQGQMVQ